MQLFIVAVGKNRGSAEHHLAEDWLSRLPEAGGIHEVESKLPAGAKRTNDEATRLLRAVPTGAALAILDPRGNCLLYTSPSPRDATLSRMPSSA